MAWQTHLSLVALHSTSQLPMDFLISCLHPLLSQLLNTVFFLGLSLGWKLRGACLSKVAHPTHSILKLHEHHGCRMCFKTSISKCMCLMTSVSRCPCWIHGDLVAFSSAIMVKLQLDLRPCWQARSICCRCPYCQSAESCHLLLFLQMLPCQRYARDTTVLKMQLFQFKPFTLQHSSSYVVCCTKLDTGVVPGLS